MTPNPNFFCAISIPREKLAIDAEDTKPVEDEKYVWTLSSELAEIAKKELGEDKEVRESSLSQLREWIRSQPHLSNCRTDNKFLLRFLRSQKFRLDKTKVILENYLRMRCENPDWFKNLDPTVPVVNEMTDSGLSLVLPKRDSSGRRVVLSYAAAVDVSRHTNADVMRTTMASIETLMEDEENQIRGITYIFYCKGLSLSHCSIWTPSDAARLFDACEKNLAVRHSDINLVRLPFTMWAVVEFVKQFLSAKIKGRINVLADEKKMAAKIGQKVLPTELGGSGGTLAEMASEWRQVMVANRGRLLALDKMVMETEKKVQEVPEKKGGGIWSYIPGL